jgi:hypothetical protein
MKAMAFILHASAFILSFTLYPFNSFQQRIYVTGFFLDGVPYEVKRGSMPQIQGKAKLLPYIGGCALERPQSLKVLLLVTFDRDIDAGIPQIISDPHLSDGHRRQAGVFEFVTNDLRNLFAQGFSDALRAMHGVRTACGSGRAFFS